MWSVSRVGVSTGPATQIPGMGFGSPPKDLIDRMLAQRAVASFEASGVGYRASLTREAAFGVFGLGTTKKTGKLFIYFAVDGVDVEVFEAHRNSKRVARKWVVEYNKEVAKLRASDPASAPQPTPAPAADDPAAALEKLSELHESGLITNEEYEAKRAEIIVQI